MPRPESDLRFIAIEVFGLIPREPDDRQRVFEIVRELQAWRNCDAEIAITEKSPALASDDGSP